MIACYSCGNVRPGRSEASCGRKRCPFPMPERHFNPLLDRGDKQDKQPAAYHRSKVQEGNLATQLGGRRVPGSGSGLRKGDVTVPGVLRIEAKTTQLKSFSVTREMVEKITTAAMGVDEIPAIVVEFLDRQGKPEYSVAVVPMSVLDRLKDLTD